MQQQRIVNVIHLNPDHHATKQSNRNLGSIAAKSAGFDVVLSTYDAIKSNEVAVPVDSLGRAILGSHERSKNSDGWLASRASDAPAKCLNLSALLRLRWCRVIFLDVLGRKGEIVPLIHTIVDLLSIKIY